MLKASNYLELLKSEVDRGGRGAHTRLAKAIGCQGPYLTRVLQGDAHLSTEQALAAARVLGCDEEHTEYFLLLVQRDRAASGATRDFFNKRLLAIRRRIQSAKKIPGSADLLERDHRILYYSQWVYSAAHLLTSMRGHQRPEDVARDLRVSLEVARATLETLVRMRLVQKKGDLYVTNEEFMFTNTEQHLMTRYQAAWRVKALEALEYPLQKKQNHFTFLLSLNKEDLVKVHTIVRQCVRDVIQVASASKEADQTLIFNGDLFSMISAD